MRKFSAELCHTRGAVKGESETWARGAPWAARRRVRVALAALVLLPFVVLHFAEIPHNPPGFFADESSIAYNAHTVARRGEDEYGRSWPLYFSAFGEYKSPVYVYLLAAVYRLTGPSIAAARALSAALGLAAALLVGLVAARSVRGHEGEGTERPTREASTVGVTSGDGAGRTRGAGGITRGVADDDVVSNTRGASGVTDGVAFAVGLVVAVSALVTPWLFEISRLVFEVALMPLALALLLLSLQSAAQRARWAWRDSLRVAASLALITYTYSAGRLLAPLLALGLVFFARRGGRRRVVLLTWAMYAATVLPVLVYNARNAGALTERFRQVGFIRPGMTWSEVVLKFLLNYAWSFSPWSWLAAGDPEPRHHVQWMGSLLIATTLAAALGLFVVLRRHAREPFWRFHLYALLVAPVPSSLTFDRFHTLRLVALPVLVLTLAAPGLAWLLERGAHVRLRRAAFAALVALTLLQGALFRWHFHRAAPTRWHNFDAFYPEVFDAALGEPQRPVYLIDASGAPGYIHAYFYGVMRGLDPAREFVRIPPNQQPPPGALVISTELPCTRCRIIRHGGPFRAYIAE